MPSPRVLIVDDQPVFRRAARDVLEARGYPVVAEADCESAPCTPLARFNPDAVLLDVCLGSESGLHVSRVLTLARPGVSVLLTSAEALQASHEHVHDCGARGFVLKSRLADVDLEAYWPARDPRAWT